MPVAFKVTIEQEIFLVTPGNSLMGAMFRAFRGRGSGCGCGCYRENIGLLFKFIKSNIHNRHFNKAKSISITLYIGARLSGTN